VLLRHNSPSVKQASQIQKQNAVLSNKLTGKRKGEIEIKNNVGKVKFDYFKIAYLMTSVSESSSSLDMLLSESEDEE